MENQWWEDADQAADEGDAWRQNQDTGVQDGQPKSLEQSPELTALVQVVHRLGEAMRGMSQTKLEEMKAHQSSLEKVHVFLQHARELSIGIKARQGKSSALLNPEQAFHELIPQCTELQGAQASLVVAEQTAQQKSAQASSVTHTVRAGQEALDEAVLAVDQVLEEADLRRGKLLTASNVFLRAVATAIADRDAKIRDLDQISGNSFPVIRTAMGVGNGLVNAAREQGGAEIKLLFATTESTRAYVQSGIDQLDQGLATVMPMMTVLTGYAETARTYGEAAGGALETFLEALVTLATIEAPAAGSSVEGNRQELDMNWDPIDPETRAFQKEMFGLDEMTLEGFSFDDSDSMDTSGTDDAKQGL